MQPIPHSNTWQNERARKLWHLKRLRACSKAPRIGLLIIDCTGNRIRTGWPNKLSILKQIHKDAPLRLCQRSQQTLPPFNGLTGLTARPSNNKRISSRYPNNRTVHKHRKYECPKTLATTETSLKAPIIFLIIPYPRGRSSNSYHLIS